jgi:TM2 domain-containing membrane protein YozV
MNAALVQTSPDKAATTISTLLLLALLGGVVGAHRFYTRKYASGLIQLLTHGGFMLWLLVDIFLIASGRFKDGQGRRVTSWF